MSIKMENEVSGFIDVITLADLMQQNSIPGMKILAHIEEEVDTDSLGIRFKVDKGVSCYKVRVYYAYFNKSVMQVYFNDQRKGADVLSKMDDVHFIYGSIYAFIKETDVAAWRGKYLIELQGRLSSVANCKCVFFLTRWARVGGVYCSIGVDVPENKFTFVRTADKDILLQTYKSGKLIYPMEPKDVRPPLQELGVELTNIRRAHIPDTKVAGNYEPGNLGELGVSVANSKIGGMIAPEKPEGAKPIVPTTVKSKSIDGGNRAIDINRGSFREACPDIIEKYNDLDARQEAINNYVVSAIPESEEDWYEYYISLLSKTLKENWFSKPDGNCGFDGRSLFRYVLEELLVEDEFKPIWDMYSHTTEIVEKWNYDAFTGVLSSMAPLRKKILYGLFQKILGLSCDLYAIDIKCMQLNRNIFDFIKHAPYRIGLITNMSLKDMDKLAIIGGHFCRQESSNDRAIAYYHDYLSDYNQMNGSTVMYEQKARLLKPGYYITGTEYMRVNNYTGDNGCGIYFEDNVRVNIKTYFELGESSMYVPKKGWISGGTYSNTFYLQTTGIGSFDSYLNEGIGVKIIIDNGSTYIADFSVYKKEIAIYKKLYSFEYILDEIDVDEYIKKFELSQGFKLEARQREAIRNCFKPENSVYTTTGGAGSGKTTLISGILYVYTMGYGYDKEDIIMVAPTGKAATQITEKTGFEAKTIHSQFKIGLPYDTDDFTAKVVIIDECSMINLDLMYQLLNRIPENCRIIMSGDINQLEPIGFGQPFADSLNFTPIVTLNVMKRAEAGSAINRNAKRMVEGYERLDQGEDFIIINELDFKSELKKQIDGLLKSGNNLRDIQVISPVSTEKYEWGTQKLNDYLQELYNDTDYTKTLRIKKYGKYVSFKVNDPVIHMENDYEMQHYVWSNEVLDVEDKGIRNGEIGYIKRIWSGEDLSEFVMEKDSELYMNCRRPNAMILEVEYTTAGNTYSIFYHCRNALRDGSIGPEGWEVHGGNLSSIQLAYAITVHKMQGSQAKHIIILWYKMKNKEFLSRNMLYTACTRAQKTVRLLCEPAVVEQARRIISADKRTSYIKEYFKNKK